MEALPLLIILLISQPAQTASLPAGAALKARLESKVGTAASVPGDPVVASVTEHVRTAGRIVIPKGSRLDGRVETISAATATSEGRIRLAFRSIQFPDGRSVSTWITDSFSASPPKRKLRYALFMGIGATAGGFVGGKSARTAGILGGALVGFVIAENTGHGKLPDVVLKPGRILQLRLGEDLLLE